MAYEYITKYTAKNYTPKAQVPAVFGYRRTIDYVTIHHWGAMESGYRPGRFYEICEYLASANSRMVSAHYVVERGKVACLISPEDASWANGNAKGNALSVTIECNPLASPEDKATVAELLAELRAAYPGKQVVVGHSYWTPTECPGLYDVFELDRMALAIEKGYPAQVKPAADNKQELEWSDMVSENRFREVIREELLAVMGDNVDVPSNQGSAESRKNNPKWTVSNALTNIWHAANVAAHNSDPERTAQAVLDAPVELQGDAEGTTNLRTKIAWQAHEFHRSTDSINALAELVRGDEAEPGADDGYSL